MLLLQHEQLLVPKFSLLLLLQQQQIPLLFLLILEHTSTFLLV